MERFNIVNPDLAIVRLSSDCLPDQFIRELYVNAVEAIQRSGVGTTVVVDADPFLGAGKDKFSVIDDGPGMTEDELREKLNLFANSSDQTTNHGVGGKLASLARSHSKKAVYYRTWKNGTGSMGILSYAPGAGFEILPLPADMKPSLIKDHGTIVTVMGNDADDSTMNPPTDLIANRQGSRWLLAYIESKFFEAPRGVRAKVRELDTDNNDGGLRHVKGLAHYLGRCDKSGAVLLPETGWTANWYLLPASHTKEGKNISNFTRVLGQTCVLLGNEIYNVEVGLNSLKRFGVYIGSGRVVIVLDPRNPEKYSANTSRSALEVVSRNGRTPLVLDAVGLEFRAKMPTALRGFMEELAGKSKTTVQYQRDRRIYDMHLPEFYADSKGTYQFPAENGVTNNIPRIAGPGGQDRGPSTSSLNPNSSPLPVIPNYVRSADMKKAKKPFSRRAGVPDISIKESPDLPKNIFASFSNHGENVLLINPEFHGIGKFSKVVEKTAGKTFVTENPLQKIDSVICRALGDQVLDVVLAALEDKQQGLITEQEFTARVSDPALTTAASARHFLLHHVRYSLARTNAAAEEITA